MYTLISTILLSFTTDFRKPTPAPADPTLVQSAFITSHIAEP